jgi:recombination protein RecA
MYKAREIRKFFRVYSRKIEKYNVGVLITNHYTATIGQMYGPKKTTTGGTGLRYAASVAMDLKIEELEIDKKIESLGASSVTIKATTTKNRCFSPRRKIDFILDFEKGVNRYSGLLKVLLDYDIVQKSGGWYSSKAIFPNGDKFYAKDFPKLVEENNLISSIQTYLEEAIKNCSEKIDDAIEGEVVDELEKKENEGQLLNEDIAEEEAADVARRLRKRRGK